MNDENPSGGEEHKCKETAPDSTAPVNVQGFPAEGTSSQSQTDSADEGSQKDRKGSRSFLHLLSLSEWLTFWVGSGSLCVGIASLVVSCLTYQNAADTSDLKAAVANLTNMAADTHRQADTAQGQLAEMQADERAWIGSPRAERSVSHGIVSFKLIFTNVGKTATGGLFIGSKIVPYEDRFESVRHQCDDGRRISADPGFIFSAIVPGESFRPPEEANPYIETSFKLGPHGWINAKSGLAVSNASIAGCTIYADRPGRSGDPKVTGFAIRLIFDGNGPKVDMIFAMAPT